jgi:hypothetical protein
MRINWSPSLAIVDAVFDHWIRTKVQELAKDVEISVLLFPEHAPDGAGREQKCAIEIRAS